MIYNKEWNSILFNNEVEARTYIMTHFQELVVVDEYGVELENIGYPTFDMILNEYDSYYERKTPDSLEVSFKLISNSTLEKNAKIYRNIDKDIVIKFCK